jgi:hypothetical protein
MKSMINTQPLSKQTLFGQQVLLLVCLSLLAGSCKKNSSGSNKPVNNSYLASVLNYSPQAQVVNSFTYDNAHRLTVFSQYDYDTTTGYPRYGSLITTFTYAGNSAIPATYSETANGSAPDLHMLYYDGGSRIIKDTSLSGDGYVAYYSYPGNNISSIVLFKGNMTDNQIDTQFVNNGNVITKHIYYPNDAGTADSLEAAAQYGYLPDVNPCYHTEMAVTIGPLLNTLTFDGFGDFGDFVSANAVSQLSGFGVPPGYVLNWKKDNNGRATNLTITIPGQSGSANIVFSYY